MKENEKQKPYWPPVFVEIIRLDAELAKMKAEPITSLEKWRWDRRARRDATLYAESLLRWNKNNRNGGPRAA